MGIDGLLKQQNVGAGTRQDLTIRYDEGQIQPPVYAGEMVIWHKNGGKGEFYEPTATAFAQLANTDFRMGGTFTVGITGEGGAFKLTSITLKLYRILSPGGIELTIKATDIAGKPTGAILATGSSSGNTLTTNAAGEEREIFLDAPFELVDNTKYAFFLKALTSDASNKLLMITDDVVASYSGGTMISSLDEGTSWTVTVGTDVWFQAGGSGDYLLVNAFGTTKQALLADI